MDRSIIYTQEQPRSYDFEQALHDAMYGLSYLGAAVLGSTGTVVAGLAATQTVTPSLTINLAAGSIYALAAADATSVGAILQDTTLILQQGLAAAQTVALSTSGISSGQSRWSLIQGKFSQVDAIRSGDPTGGVLFYYNAANPQSPFQGPGGSGAAQSTVRQGVFTLQVTNGAAATTGLEVPPNPTSGWVPLYLIDLTFGQTTVLTSQILTAAPSVGTGVPSNYPYAPFIAGLLQSHHSGNPGQAPKINLSSEVSGVLPTANLPIGAFSTVAALRANTAQTAQFVVLEGYHSPGDGGSGVLYRLTSPTTDNGVYIYNDTAGVSYQRIGINEITPGMAGLVLDNATDDTTALGVLAAVSNVYPVRWPEALIAKVTGTTPLPAGARFVGSGTGGIQQYTANTAIFSATAKANISISDMSFVGLGTDFVDTSPRNALAIVLTNCTNAKVNRNSFTNFSYSAVRFFQCQNPSFNDNTVVGITGLTSANLNCYGVLFDGVKVAFTGSVGGATSGTLTAAMTNGTYLFVFSDSEQRQVTVSGGTSCTWTSALSAGTITVATVGCVGNTASRNDISIVCQGIITNESMDVVSAENKIHDTYQHGMYLGAGLQGCAVGDNDLWNIGLVGVKVQCQDYSGVDNVSISITGGSIRNAGSHGVDLQNGSTGSTQRNRATAVTGVVVDGCAGHSVHISDSVDVSVKSCLLKGAAGSAVFFEESEHVDIEENQIINTGLSAIRDGLSSKYVNIRNNKIADCCTLATVGDRYAVFIQGTTGLENPPSDITIEGNLITDIAANMEAAVRIAVVDQSTFIVRNNEGRDATGYGLILNSPSTMRSYRDNIWNGTLGSVSAEPLLPSVASASTITLPQDSQVVTISGNVDMHNITLAGFMNQTVVLAFSGTLVVHNDGNIGIPANFSATPGSSLRLTGCRTAWH